MLTESVSNASFGIYLPRFTGTIYEILSAPVSALEVLLGFVGAAATKSVLLGLIIFFTARLFVSFELVHPFWALAFLVLISVTFALFGFMLGLWADGFEKLQIVPLMVISPLTFLGGTFYSIDMLPPFWRNVALFNPDRLSGRRLSLGLLRHSRRRPGDQLRPDPDHAAGLRRRGGLDFQDRLSAANLSAFKRSGSGSREGPLGPR